MCPFTCAVYRPWTRGIDDGLGCILRIFTKARDLQEGEKSSLWYRACHDGMTTASSDTIPDWFNYPECEALLGTCRLIIRWMCGVCIWNKSSKCICGFPLLNMKSEILSKFIYYLSYCFLFVVYNLKNWWINRNLNCFLPENSDHSWQTSNLSKGHYFREIKKITNYFVLSISIASPCTYLI